jgi:small subunit ribosomal protein S17e
LLTSSTLQTVKKSAKVLVERYYPRLTLDFEVNKRTCDEVAIIASKRLRNKVGFTSIMPSTSSSPQ